MVLKGSNLECLVGDAVGRRKSNRYYVIKYVLGEIILSAYRKTRNAHDKSVCNVDVVTSFQPTVVY